MYWLRQHNEITAVRVGYQQQPHPQNWPTVFLNPLFSSFSCFIKVLLSDNFIKFRLQENVVKCCIWWKCCQIIIIFLFSRVFSLAFSVAWKLCGKYCLLSTIFSLIRVSKWSKWSTFFISRLALWVINMVRNLVRESRLVKSGGRLLHHPIF